MSRPKVVDISIQVTCLEDDFQTVRNSLNEWFCSNDTPLVERPKTGGIRCSAPRSLQPWMKETLCPS